MHFSKNCSYNGWARILVQFLMDKAAEPLSGRQCTSLGACPYSLTPRSSTDLLVHLRQLQEEVYAHLMPLSWIRHFRRICWIYTHSQLNKKNHFKSPLRADFYLNLLFDCLRGGEMSPSDGEDGWSKKSGQLYEYLGIASWNKNIMIKRAVIVVLGRWAAIGYLGGD